MATARQADRRNRTASPWWRPAVYSAAATAAIAALFNPLPAFAAPNAPQAPGAPINAPQVPDSPIAVPDVGSRPVALGTLVLPGQPATPSTPAATPIVGAATSPALQQIEKGRAEIATMGDQLIQVGQERDLAKTQQETTEQRYDQAVTLLQEARAAAATAAAQSVMEAAALPPGAFDSGLVGLDDLARLQRGDAGSQQAAARQLEIAETSVQLALDENALTKKHYDELVSQYNTLNTQLNKKQAAQQALELKHADELTAAEATETATDNQLGKQYLAGETAGRGADPRAIKALEFALAQRGDPYVWSEEGPNAYDCSGLMWAAYRSVGFQLERVSRDQYWQTHEKVVDRYSLLPGDLLFFSYSNSWRGIHHVAMYAGNGYMVEAPRTGLNVRLVPVRWTRLFQATRVFGSVPGVTEGPALGTPDPDTDTGTTTPDNSSPATSKPGTPKPSTSTSKPGTHPTTPSTPPTTPSTSPSGTKPTTDPTTTKPTTPTDDPTSTPPTTGTTTTPAPDDSTPSGGESSGGSNPPSNDSTSSSAATSTSSAATSTSSTKAPSSSSTSSTKASSSSSSSSASSTSSAKATEEASASASAG